MKNKQVKKKFVKDITGFCDGSDLIDFVKYLVQVQEENIDYNLRIITEKDYEPCYCEDICSECTSCCCDNYKSKIYIHGTER